MARVRRFAGPAGDATRAAGLHLLEIYSGLAQRTENLLSSLLRGQSPRQWVHYPEDDAIDPSSGYQWFYHSHSLEDRSGAIEHGHIHLFAQRKRWSRRLLSMRERTFAELTGTTDEQINTRHLLAISFDPKGLPRSFFTVNSWVTGDLMLSAETTAELLDQMALDTGNADVDGVILSLVRLFKTEIVDLLAKRNETLFRCKGSDVLFDESLEVLSERSIDIDSKLVQLFGP